MEFNSVHTSKLTGTQHQWRAKGAVSTAYYWLINTGELRSSQSMPRRRRRYVVVKSRRVVAGSFLECVQYLIDNKECVETYSGYDRAVVLNGKIRKHLEG